MNILFIPIILYIYTHINLAYNNKNKHNKNIYHYTYFIWEQTYHNKEINSCLNTFYIFYLGTNISQQSIKIFTKKKRSIKFIPQYIFICFIWEQTYHNKALNFSPKKKKKTLNSYLIAFLYILLDHANECP